MQTWQLLHLQHSHSMPSQESPWAPATLPDHTRVPCVVPPPFLSQPGNRIHTGSGGRGWGQEQSHTHQGPAVLIFQGPNPRGQRVCLMGHGPGGESLGKDSYNAALIDCLQPWWVTPVSPHPLLSFSEKTGKTSHT